MRSLNLRRIQSPAKFDLHVNYNTSIPFPKKHENYCASYIVQPAAATCHRLISDYWGDVL
ncbi:hypothetical protein Cpin_2902 [Chitinophaga pinensis DSM 2588]|uniref:Uncharacterized protein n=1 Tax=Chitinophaga pinensis (strain ATCC 43595 / DSM 2588 / LMG 13176 / NBRC 15968 / NCIMB 11800 / UQM 2034) TaxID=485918 RepID=A0A979GUG0_CHIPD|nr:hypothetical protein Cpin_2902 [Chitinophaga pinensis DSM 2588]